MSDARPAHDAPPWQSPASTSYGVFRRTPRPIWSRLPANTTDDTTAENALTMQGMKEPIGCARAETRRRP